MNEDKDRFKEIPNKKLKNTRVFGDRFTAIMYVVPDKPRYLEIGVGDGHYSQHIVYLKKPTLMHLLDIYDEGNGDVIYGRYTPETHEDFIREKFKDQNVTTIRGWSTKVLPTLAGNQYDYIYIDASLYFDEVLEELELSASLLAPGGVIGINDYTYYSPIDKMEYEVVEAVNMFLHNNPEWYVYAYQLGHRGYADIYIKRD